MKNLTRAIVFLFTFSAWSSAAFADQNSTVLPLPLTVEGRLETDRYLLANIDFYVANTNRLQNISNCETNSINGGSMGLEGSDLNAAVYQYCIVAGAQLARLEPRNPVRAAFFLLRSQGIATAFLAYEVVKTMSEDEIELLGTKDYLYYDAEAIGEVEELGGSFDKYLKDQLCFPVWVHNLRGSPEYNGFCAEYIKS